MGQEINIFNSKILIVDDEFSNVRLIERILKMEGFNFLKSTTDPRKVKTIYEEYQPDLVMLDLKMPQLDGFEIMEQLKKIEKDSYIPVLVLTAQADEKTQMRALDAGAKDFIGKPFNHSEVLCRIKNILEVRLMHKQIKEQNLILEEKVQQRTAELTEANLQLDELRKQLELENAYLREEIQNEFSFGQILGKSQAIKDLCENIKLIAETDSTVLIEGETGTGKELVARTIHEQSDRRKHPLVKVNCGAIPRELFESEFFGHLKGAFTGATKERMGRFKLAHEGTLFLDEVGEIPLELQSKLLRVLQDGQFEPVGDEKTREVDVRIIAATNRDLKEEVRCKRFREDLYYRLSVVPIYVAPLRERLEDIEILANHFMNEICKRLNKKSVTLTKKNLEQLIGYDWPGNLRELQNVMERTIIISKGGPLEFNLLSSSQKLQENSLRVEDILSIDEEKDRIRENILAALKKCNWKIYGSGGAAELLGIFPQTLSYKIKKLGLKNPG